MQQSRNNKTAQKHMNTISKLLDYEYSYESKESTCEEMYQQIMKHKANLRRENHNLKRQIQQTKENILSKALGIYFTELRELSQNNQYLREKHRVIYETNKPVKNRNGGDDAYSPLHTPRSRRSIVNIYNNDNNQLSKQGPSNLQSRQSDLHMHKRPSLNIQNNQNIKPPTLTHTQTQIYGRSSLKITQCPRRTNTRNLQHQQQLTERKMINSVYLGTSLHSLHAEGFQNVSTFSESNSIRQSVRSQVGAERDGNGGNLFCQFVQVMLEEEKIKENQMATVLRQAQQGLNIPLAHQQLHLPTLQHQLQKTQKSIQTLSNLLQSYQLQIKQTQLNITTVTDMTKQLSTLNLQYHQMRQKCLNIEHLRVEVASKERKLKELRDEGKGAFVAPMSVRVMLRVLGVGEADANGSGSGDSPVGCKRALKGLVRNVCGDKNIAGSMINNPNAKNKKIKIKQLLDTIRQGRKKFKQLMTVYQGRIKKLQKKLTSFRKQQKQKQLQMHRESKNNILN